MKSEMPVTSPPVVLSEEACYEACRELRDLTHRLFGFLESLSPSHKPRIEGDSVASEHSLGQ